MANGTTQPYHRSFAGSVGAGMGSVFNPGGRKYYILEHKVSTRYHRAGENQEIIIDQIELGRNSHCQVRFDESFGTVSRRHAAIVRDGDNWKLVQISQTNTTLLNGRPIKNEWYLQNGDEIQLAVNGPKLSFIVPSGKKSTVGSIGLTRRLSLFRQQALRPYKNAIAVLSCLLLLLAMGGGYKLYDLHNENLKLDAAIAESQKEQQRLAAANDSIAKEVVEKGQIISDMQRQMAQFEKGVSGRVAKASSSARVKSTNNSELKACDANVFYIQALGFEVALPSGEKYEIECGSGNNKLPGWSGTGFLLSDGRFVTARHVVEAWYYPQHGNSVDEKMLMLNAIANNGGTVVAYFGAVSSSGTKFTFKSSQCRVNRSNDEEYHTENGDRLVIASASGLDFATVNTGRNGGLPFDSQASTQLERGTKLTVLGFPLGLGANSMNDINPIYGSGIVAADGLQNGVIVTTDTNFEQGNSGGPVFYNAPDGQLTVIGVVSAYAGRSTGFIVPIAAIR